MYRLINDRIGEITQTFTQTHDLEEYNWLVFELHEKDVSTSAEYRVPSASLHTLVFPQEPGQAPAHSAIP